MIQHRRTPAVAILLAVLGLGWAAMFWSPARGAATSGPDRFRRAGDQTLAQLEIAIASERATAEDWYAYAEHLRKRQQPQDAALAYRKALELQPYHRDARFHCAVALAAAGNAEEFYSFMRDLVWSNAKLAVDIFGRPESQAYLPEARFRALAQEAQNQALD